MARNLTEKTLELHIHAEIYHHFQNRGVTPVMVGFTQAQEIALGADSEIKWGIGPSAGVLILQFKRVHRFIRHFTFYINDNSANNQHAMLMGFGARRRLPSYYALPLIGTEEDLIRNSPGLLALTMLLEASSVGPPNPREARHRVVIHNSNPLQAEIYSKPLTVPLVKFPEILGGLLDGTAGITVADLKFMLGLDSDFRVGFRQGWWGETLPRFQSHWGRLRDADKAESPLAVLPKALQEPFRQSLGKDADERLRLAFEARPDTPAYHEANALIKTVPIENVLLQQLTFTLCKFSKTP